MLKIRLQRIGRRNEPHFRMLVTDSAQGPKSNKFVEKVGTFNPRTKELQLKVERIKHWISVGAQTSGRVHNMLVKEGIIKGKAINVLPQKSPVVDEEKIAKEKEAAEAKKAAAEEAKKEAEAPKEEDAVEEKAEDTEEKAKDAPTEEVKEEETPKEEGSKEEEKDEDK